MLRYNENMLILTIIIILVGCIIALVIYYTEKNKEAVRENKKLKQNMVSSGYSYEQLEFHLERIRKDIQSLQKEDNVQDMQSAAEKIKHRVDQTLKMLSSSSRAR